MRQTTVRKTALLGKRDQLLDIGAKLLRLGDGGLDLLMLDECRRLVTEQGRTMARGALQLTAANTMTHGNFPSFVRGPCEVTPAWR